MRQLDETQKINLDDWLNDNLAQEHVNLFYNNASERTKWDVYALIYISKDLKINIVNWVLGMCHVFSSYDVQVKS